MDWIRAVEHLRAQRRPGVLVTLTDVRGHSPREAGAKLVVAADGTWGSVGGGNLEETAVVRGRAMIEAGADHPESETFELNERAPAAYGVQCCGGTVSALFEPLAVVPAVAVFGLGHVGMELARVLARHDIELHLVDSRAAQVSPERMRVLDDAVARVHLHQAPVPELVLGQVPAGTHVLVLTHDHAEDVALCDAALRCGHLASIGLIGSSAKWRRFEKRLLAEGHTAEDLRRISTPIGVPEITGKDPATIAVSVAAHLVQVFEAERAPRRVSS